jgi:hypothetical protein
MSDELDWLQRWFLSHCDGEWEHGFGITIENLDNPGWQVTVALEGTDLETVSFEPIQKETSETDWIHCRVVERKRNYSGDSSKNYRRFEGSGGPCNLSDILGVLHQWAEAHR